MSEHKIGITLRNKKNTQQRHHFSGEKGPWTVHFAYELALECSFLDALKILLLGKRARVAYEVMLDHKVDEIVRTTIDTYQSAVGEAVKQQPETLQ